MLFIVVRMAAVTFEQPQPRGDEYAEYETGVVTDILSDNTEADTKFMGDGNRMYRVVQNVIENALKYSLKGTRIFIYITEEAGNIVLKVTNTASYEMNFTEEEIMERFARAEKSRTSEGNGLGLSIADSFTKNCGGKFEIKIEGDQFTVTIQFKQYFKENK